MKNILRWISWQKVVFFLVLATVIYQNKLSAGQYLSGWDNLQPEINFGLEVSRQLSAVWQEFRGLGHLGGMGHAADLPRTLILWLFSWVVPTQMLRWSWHVAMLALGPIGVWYMGRKLRKWGELACLSASTFYLLNLATVQYFYTPYEAFSAFYGFLPWLISSYILYLENGKKRDVLRLLVISVLATTAFYVQTLFVVYALILGVISITYLRKWKRVLGGWLVVLAANAFWLLPVVYFVISNAGVVGVSKINSIASPETAYMNEAMGGWRDVLILRGFWIEYIEWKGNKWGRLLQVWQAWSSNSIVFVVSLVLAGISIMGIVVGAIKRRIGWWVVGVFLLSYFMLASNNPPLGNVYSYLISKIPFFGEMFRSVFTKWSDVMGLVMVLGVGVFTELVSVKKWIGIVATFVILGLSGYVVWPVFSGNLIFQSMKVEYPKGYEKLYGFFQDQDKSTRVAYLPSAWAWGWQYHDWGYRGSGFLWYGIEQPILDRAFDVWSPYNEGFYNELSNFLYQCQSDKVSQCGEQVARVIEKYDVRFVLLDESVIAPGQGKEILRIEETKKLAEELGWEKVFNEGFLSVWDVSNSQITNDKFSNGEHWISAPETYTLAEGDSIKAREDVIFYENGSYVSGIGGAQYPFASLMREEIPAVAPAKAGEGSVVWGEGEVRIISNLKFSNSHMIVPGWEVGEIVRLDYQEGEAIPAYSVNGQAGPRFLGKERPMDGKSYFYARVSEGEEWREYRSEQKFEIRNEKLEIEVRGEPFVYDFAKQGQGTIGNCDVLKRGNAEKTVTSDTVTRYVADERGAVCDYVVMEEAFVRVPYLMRIRGENAEGRSVKFFLWNTGSKRNDIEYLLGKGKFDQTFSLLPWDWDGYYTLNIETRSFGQLAENRIEPVVGMYVPLEKIARAKLVGSQNGEYIVTNNADITYVKKTGTWLYGLGVKGDGLIRLSQGYDEGWVGIIIGDWSWNDPFGFAQGLRHVKVDGWANGFVLNNEPGAASNANQMVVIFYWPQLLQYLGLVMLGITVLGLWLPVRLRGR